jgi:predicted dehydrogenase
VEELRMTKQLDRPVSRRDILRRGVAAAGTWLAAPVIIPAAVLGRGGAVAPSERITLAAIGLGGRCRGALLPHFAHFDQVRMLAVCDCWAGRRKQGREDVKRHYGYDCDTYADIHEVLARDDLDGVILATGDRMHAVGSILAARAGKDVYCEKPMTLTIEEGQALVKATEQFGTVWQCGHQRRSVDIYRFTREVVRRGLLGRVHTCMARVWANPFISPQPDQPNNAPAGLDWNTWLGPTPYQPFNPGRLQWPFFWDTSAGVLVAMGCHYTDLAQFVLDRDHTACVDYHLDEATYAPGNFADAPITSKVACIYEDGTKLILDSRGAFEERYIEFIGDDGSIRIYDEGRIVSKPASLAKLRAITQVHYNDMGGHVADFLNCIRTRRRTRCHPLNSHRATTIAHAAVLSTRLGRDLKWDPKTERFVGDDEANRMISRSMRAPWTL